MILASLLNSYPRIGDLPSEQALRRAIARADRGEAAPSSVADAEDEMTRRAIDEQREAGLDILTDGQIRWHDPVSHIARGLSGFRIGGLLRYFDTNTYYRQPVATGRIGRASSILLPAYRFAAGAAAPRPVKAIVTGPLTLARLSRLGKGRRLRGMALEIASALNRELLDLAGAGAGLIQIDEPAIARSPGDLPILRGALPRLIRGLRGCRTILATSFGGVGSILADLSVLPVSMIGIDLLAAAAASGGGKSGAGRPVTARRGSSRLVKTLPRDRGLVLGVVDGRNTRLEDPEELFHRLLHPLLPAIRDAAAPEGREIHLTPNHGLEFLPRETARAKMRLLARLRDRLREALA